MELKIDDIEKYDIIVRKKYPTVEMRRVENNKLIWVGECGRVATMEIVNNKINFYMEK
jgi:uncharacterized protein YuzE